MLKAGLTVAIVLLASAAVAQPLAVASGTALTFTLTGAPPKPGLVRRRPIGASEPADGEITISLAPAGNAVRVAKLHVYERSHATIAFEATAMRGTKVLATQIVCGHLETDSWVTFPATTEAVALSGFAMTEKSCGQ